MAEAAYTAKDITVLEGLEPVRLRPGMYIGSTGSRGLHHLIFEVVDNSVDEALAGRADLVEVLLHPDNSVTVRDNGSGIPVDVMPDQGLPAVTVVLTKLHAGGKFGGEGYKVSGGLHGVGVSVVNALSEWLTVEVSRDGKIWKQEFARGEPTTDLKAIGPTKETGTTVVFMPDHEVFDEVEWQEDVLIQRLRETAFLTKGLRIVFKDERAGGKSAEFHYEGGIKDFVAHVNQTKDPLHKTIVYFESDTNADMQTTGVVEVAMQWNGSYVESVFSFANNINTQEGGSHLTGFRSALTATLNKYARDKGLLKEKEDNLEGEDVREGLAAVISVKLSEPQFEGQTKTKLGNAWVEGLVKQTVNQRLAEFLEENPTEARQIINKAVSAARARQAARKARDLTRRKSALESNSLPGRAGRLPDQRSGVRRALPRRGPVRRRLGRRRPRPDLPGDPAAPRQGHQCGEEQDQQGSLERGDPVHRDSDRHGDRRGARHLEAPLPPRDRHDGRGRRRRSHPDAHPHLPLPADAGARRARARVHRRRAALPREDRECAALRREGVAARGHARPGADQGHGCAGPQRRNPEADRGTVRPAGPRAARVRWLGIETP